MERGKGGNKNYEHKYYLLPVFRQSRNDSNRRGSFGIRVSQREFQPCLNFRTSTAPDSTSVTVFETMTGHETISNP